MKTKAHGLRLVHAATLLRSACHAQKTRRAATSSNTASASLFALTTSITTEAMFVLATEHPVLASLSVLLLGWLVKSLHKGYTVRKTFHGQVRSIRHTRHYGTWLTLTQPGPPHSWLWGHLKVMGDMMDGSIPDLVHPHSKFDDGAIIMRKPDDSPKAAIHWPKSCNAARGPPI